MLGPAHSASGPVLRTDTTDVPPTSLHVNDNQIPVLFSGLFRMSVAVNINGCLGAWEVQITSPTRSNLSTRFSLQLPFSCQKSLFPARASFSFLFLIGRISHLDIQLRNVNMARVKPTTPVLKSRKLGKAGQNAQNANNTSSSTPNKRSTLHHW